MPLCRLLGQVSQYRVSILVGQSFYTRLGGRRMYKRNVSEVYWNRATMKAQRRNSLTPWALPLMRRLRMRLVVSENFAGLFNCYRIFSLQPWLRPTSMTY